MENKQGKFSWSKLPKEAEKVLGDDFWDDLRTFFPKKGPHIDFIEMKNEAIIYMELPGVETIKDIRIKKIGSKIAISGYIPNHTHLDAKTILEERFTGSFERILAPPFSFSTKEVKAKFQNGLLEIKLRKSHVEESIDLHLE